MMQLPELCQIECNFIFIADFWSKKKKETLRAEFQKKADGIDSHGQRDEKYFTDFW